MLADAYTERDVERRVADFCDPRHADRAPNDPDRCVFCYGSHCGAVTLDRRVLWTTRLYWHEEQRLMEETARRGGGLGLEPSELLRLALVPDGGESYDWRTTWVCLLSNAPSTEWITSAQWSERVRAIHAQWTMSDGRLFVKDPRINGFHTTPFSMCWWHNLLDRRDTRSDSFFAWKAWAPADPPRVAAAPQVYTMGLVEDRARRSAVNARIARAIYEIENPTPSKSDRARRCLSNSTKIKVLQRDGMRCRYCGRGVPDGVKLVVDHIHPIALGGDNSLRNLAAACTDCNAGKHARPGIAPLPMGEAAE